MSGDSGEPLSTCRDCGVMLVGRYCTECGHDSQWAPQPFGEALPELWDEFLALDRRFLKTVTTLVTKPGTLSTLYLRGRRRGLTSPLRLYIALGFLAAAATRGFGASRSVGSLELNLSGAHFLASIIEIISSATEAEFPPAVYEAAAQVGPWIGLVVFSPLLGFGLSKAFRRSGRLYVEHLVVAVHFQSFVFLVVAMEAVCLWLVPQGALGTILQQVLVIGVILYSGLVLQSFYGVAAKTLVAAWIEAALFFYLGVAITMLVIYVVAVQVVRLGLS